MIAPSPNSGHTATHCSAKIRLRRTSYVRKTLGEMLFMVGSIKIIIQKGDEKANV